LKHDICEYATMLRLSCPCISCYKCFPSRDTTC